MLAAIKVRFFEVIDFYVDLFEHHDDPRTREWFMITSLWIPLTILFIYFFISITYGPYLMKDRRPIEVGDFLTFYNLFILAFNGLLTVFFVYYQIILQYSPICQRVSTVGGEELMLAKGFYAFYISKICELSDTLIIILKKKAHQLTFLHRYHHSSMVMLVWVGLRFSPGGSSIVLATINTFFHFVIYAYYYISLYELRIFSMLSFRGVTTFSQLIQFALVILHCLTAYFKNCGYPQPVLIWLIFYVASFVLLYIWYTYLSQMCSTTCTTEVQTNEPSPKQQPTEKQSVNLVPRPVTFPSQTSPKNQSHSKLSPASTAAEEESSTKSVNRREIKKQSDKMTRIQASEISSPRSDKKMLQEQSLPGHLEDRTKPLNPSAVVYQTNKQPRGKAKLEKSMQLEESKPPIGKRSRPLSISSKNNRKDSGVLLRKTSGNPHLYPQSLTASAGNSVIQKNSVIGALIQVNRTFNVNYDHP